MSKTAHRHLNFTPQVYVYQRDDLNDFLYFLCALIFPKWCRIFFHRIEMIVFFTLTIGSPWLWVNSGQLSSFGLKARVCRSIGDFEWPGISCICKKLTFVRISKLNCEISATLFGVIHKPS